ncbi:hypothetical protein UFOVP1288_75 [uncultured Caudovirales phage]|uniref:Uncharacterized protein n=1 Tax=uncultured Caudovirales phage TaxID=2100421 RepID=A0A6J5RG85_9CAUD|nr:hypothetical protein UFOVP1195_75 [uncultured Caudovirales phage]CAB4196303.1 hypothetical protein UFOVP1288_75 [uncultured Caudovirales phage]CAB4205217.1 hypothetical protein UFOVP1409_75 [uncultured Caudovirales phage]
MRRVIISKTGTGSSATASMDQYISPFNVGMGAVTSGTINYTVQHTYDNIFDSAVTPVWFDHATMASKTGNFDGSYAYPVAGIKVLVNSGTGTVTLTLLQAGDNR